MSVALATWRAHAMRPLRLMLCAILIAASMWTVSAARAIAPAALTVHMLAAIKIAHSMSRNGRIACARHVASATDIRVPAPYAPANRVLSLQRRSSFRLLLLGG